MSPPSDHEDSLSHNAATFIDNTANPATDSIANVLEEPCLITIMKLGTPLEWTKTMEMLEMLEMLEKAKDVDVLLRTQDMAMEVNMYAV